jgi:hypothetical protein
MLNKKKENRFMRNKIKSRLTNHIDGYPTHILDELKFQFMIMKSVSISQDEIINTAIDEISRKYNTIKYNDAKKVFIDYYNLYEMRKKSKTELTDFTMLDTVFNKLSEHGIIVLPYPDTRDEECAEQAKIDFAKCLESNTELRWYMYYSDICVGSASLGNGLMFNYKSRSDDSIEDMKIARDICDILSEYGLDSYIHLISHTIIVNKIDIDRLSDMAGK